MFFYICHISDINIRLLAADFCLRAEAVMAARFSFVIEGIKETLEWFQ